MLASRPYAPDARLVPMTVSLAPAQWTWLVRWSVKPLDRSSMTRRDRGAQQCQSLREVLAFHQFEDEQQP